MEQASPPDRQPHTAPINLAQLAPVVAQVLNKPDVEVLDWQEHKFSGNFAEAGGEGFGVYRILGSARDGEGIYPWSVIVKIQGGLHPFASNDPGAWNYWKREALAYQSGLINQLPKGLGVPRCYAVHEHPDDTLRLWLEDIQSPADEWTIERYGLAAHHLGQFNGAYLAGHPLPLAEPWLCWGRARQWGEEALTLLDGFRECANTPIAKSWFGRAGVERTIQLVLQNQKLLQAFEKLPVCFCHHDAFRRNLLARVTPEGHRETVAIDWAITGFGRVGEEAGATTALSLGSLDVPTKHARELDQTVFSAYLDGLREAGWRGDDRLARLGYAANAFLLVGAFWNMYWLSAIQQAENIAPLEKFIGHPLDEIIDAYAGLLPFLLAMGEEALALADSG